MASLEVGISKAKVLELLRPFKTTCMIEVVSGGWSLEKCQLDDAWVLRSDYDQAIGQGYILRKAELIESVRDVWIAPPTNFTGLWVRYFVNGRKSEAIHYQNGGYSGEYVAYHSDGSKGYVEHFKHHVGEGKTTGFFPSGRVHYEGVEKAGKQAGIWTWYKEDGSIESTRDYSKP